MRELDVCLSPELIPSYDLNGRIAVIADILRATSCITTGLASGVTSIKPFSNIEQCSVMKAAGFLIAGERNGQKVEGFDIGNSPFNYMDPSVKGQKIAITTTNGTQAIERSEGCEEMIIGAFLNLSTVVDYLRKADHDILIVCAGWKGRPSLEDTLFAGAVMKNLENEFIMESDACRLTQSVYHDCEGDLTGAVLGSSHARRLKRLNIENDIEFCMTHNKFGVLPVYEDGIITLHP